MQGQMYSYNGRVKIDGVVYEDGTKALEALEDYNCLHFKTGVLLGVSQPTYSKEELERIHQETTEKIEYNGKEKTLYEWKQTQRRLERGYRKAQTQSDMFKASGNNIAAKEYQDKADAIRATYNDLTSSVPGLYDRSERMQTYFKDTKPLTSNGNGGIIKTINVRDTVKIEDEIIKEIKEIGIKGDVIIGSVPLDISQFAFDDEHINKERLRNINREEAEHFKDTAKFMVKRWNGRFGNYYSEDGAVFIDIEQQNIRTAFRRDEYTEEIIKALEVLKKYGK
jgi:hypothetical protein